MTSKAISTRIHVFTRQMVDTISPMMAGVITAVLSVVLYHTSTLMLSPLIGRLHKYVGNPPLGLMIGVIIGTSVCVSLSVRNRQYLYQSAMRYWIRRQCKKYMDPQEPLIDPSSTKFSGKNSRAFAGPYCILNHRNP